jgi:hypothetical protein
VRDFIAERGYRPTADDIRICRQDLLLRGSALPFADFSSISGCRDLLFNVMEHRFTLPQIGAFLDANDLSFLGFEQLPSGVNEQFRQQFAESAAVRDLESWHSFEQLHPQTFSNMYMIWMQKRGRDPLHAVARSVDRPESGSLS